MTTVAATPGLAWRKISSKTHVADVVPGRLSVVLRRDPQVLGSTTWTATALLHDDTAGWDIALRVLLAYGGIRQTKDRLAQLTVDQWLSFIRQVNRAAEPSALTEVRTILELDPGRRLLLGAMNGMRLTEALELVEAALA